jgi:hypothetical protein
MKIYIIIPAIAVGTFLGGYGCLYACGSLEEKYRPAGVGSSDMPIWLLFPLAMGAMLGGITVSAICSQINKHYRWASAKCILTAVLLLFGLADLLTAGFSSPITFSDSDIRYQLAPWSPIFIWCGALFIYGLILLYKSRTRKS